MKGLPIFTAILICLLTSHSNKLQAQQDSLFFVPQIKYGKAILTGQIEGIIPIDQGFKSLTVRFNNVVTSDLMNYEIPVKKDGTFTFSIPIVTVTIAALVSDYFEGTICLIPGEETKLKIIYNSKKEKQVELVNSIGLTANDAQELMNFPMGLPDIGYEIVSPEIYSQRVIMGIPRILNRIQNDTKLSVLSKQLLINETKLLCIFYRLFDYGQYIKDVYKNQHKTDTVPKDLNVQLPAKSYYTFLKYFDLNDPSYLSAGSYVWVLQSILSNETLSIPSINSMPFNKWLINVKEILKNAVGSDSGLFYDLLVSNAYGKQLNDMNPLSDIQKKNIRSYFINKSFVNILMDANEKVVQLSTKSNNLNIQKTSKSTGNVMDSIISKHKGKVVFVDFWATWCAPCLRAMKESESVRAEFENKDVVFVYITDPSSPRKAWEEKISEIHGEHYYLTEKEWGYINKFYDFTAIPHYLIFDKNGTLKYNYSSFMGVENMRKWIEKYL